jgi:aryl sulfotransferase
VTERVHYRTFMFDNARWDGFKFRDGDIVISTSPKSGTTWTQMLCALLIFQDPQLPRPLSHISPWLDQQTRKLDTVFATLDAQQHRRFIKTHTPFDGLPVDDRVTYLCVGRDPRDVFLSMDHHWGNMDMEAVRRARDAAVGSSDAEELLSKSPMVNRPDDERERFRVWVDNDLPPDQVSSSLRAVLHHVNTFWMHRDRDNVALFHYADFEADLVAEMERLAVVLEIDISTDRVRQLAAAADFEEMKGRAGEFAPNADIGIWRDTNEFFHQGKSGQWHASLTGDDLAHYEARVRELAAPDLAEWIHHGWSKE